MWWHLMQGFSVVEVELWCDERCSLARYKVHAKKNKINILTLKSVYEWKYEWILPWCDLRSNLCRWVIVTDFETWDEGDNRECDTLSCVEAHTSYDLADATNLRLMGLSWFGWRTGLWPCSKIIPSNSLLSFTK